MKPKKIAFVFDLPKHSKTKHHQTIEKFLHPKIPFDIHYLADNDELDRVLVRDMTLAVEELVNNYLFIVPVGAEPFKKLIKHKGGITKYNGVHLTEPFTCVPIISPLILYLNPSMLPKVQNCFDSILELYNANGVVKEAQSTDYKFIDDITEARQYLKSLDNTVIAYDLETSALDPLEGEIIGASFSNSINKARFIPVDVLNEINNTLNTVLNNNLIIMHNAKFDMKWTKYKLGITIPNFEDTMIVHYLFINQTKGTHSLKNLAMEHTNLKDYSREQDEFVAKFRRQNKILVADFSFSMIPIELLSPYACADADATLQLYENMAKPALEKANPLTVKCYREIMLPASAALIEVELVGAPIDKTALSELEDELNKDIIEAQNKLAAFKEVKAYKADYGDLNLNSPAQLGRLLFDYFKFKSVKETGTGNRSTDVEVLTTLGKTHKFPGLVIALRKLNKLKGTYVSNIRELIQTNGRLRGTFNLTTTESGRLSSSKED